MENKGEKIMIKVGIIGFGYMGHFHYEKAKHFDDVQVMSAFDTNQERLDNLKQDILSEYNIQIITKACDLSNYDYIIIILHKYENVNRYSQKIALEYNLDLSNQDYAFL